jgi:hypothetical protein
MDIFYQKSCLGYQLELPNFTGMNFFSYLNDFGYFPSKTESGVVDGFSYFNF